MIASAYRFAARRSAMPMTLEEAARFSKVTDSYDAAVLIDALRNYMRVYKPLRRALSVRAYDGPCRPRKPGRYEFLYIYFVLSGSVDVFNWYYANRSRPEMWLTCEFDPTGVSYATVQRRFAELEEYEHAFSTALAMLVRLARRFAPEIAAYIHVDGTEASTSARFQHDCQPGEGCQHHHSHLTLTHDEAVAIRQALAELPEEELDDEPQVRDSYVEEFDRGEKKRGPRPKRRIFRGGHWWASTDLDAGTRMYENRKIWDGYIAMQATDHFTGLSLNTRIYPANLNESTAYPDLMDRTIQTAGVRPIAVAGDRGYDLSPVYEYNGARGIGSAFIRRKKQNPPPAVDSDKVPLCKHCGGGTDFVSHVEVGEGKYELRVSCSLPISADCEKIQSHSASQDPKYIVPLWATNPIYIHLTDTHSSYERTHFQARRRQQTGPKSHTAAPRRTGIACQQLRATVGNLLNWLTLCLKYGWIRGHQARFIAKRKAATDSWRKKHDRRMNRRRDRGVLGGAARIRRE